MRSNNPVLDRVEKLNEEVNDRASYKGVAIKTGILFMIVVLSAFLSLTLAVVQTDLWVVLMTASPILAFVFAMIGQISIKIAKPMSILYSIFEGVTLGALSFLVNALIENAAFIALTVTLTIFAVMLILYSSKTIRVGNKFRRFMYASSLSLLLAFIIFFVADLVSGGTLFASSNIGILIGISLFLIFYGALMLLMDFDRATYLVEFGVDSRVEWNISLGLILSLVWIYVEVLRLIILVVARNDK